MKQVIILLPLLLLVFSCGNNAQPEAAEEAMSTAVPPETTAPAAPALPYKNVSPLDFAELMGSPNVVLLDVRTPAEVADGKIGDALEINFQDPAFAAQLDQLETGKTYLVYCAGGGRSSKTCELLAEKGYQKLYNLAGGYAAWKGN